MGIKGKKLLVLGAADAWGSFTDFDFVRIGHEMDLYVIVTDSSTDWDLAPAKKIADEGWDISWSDIDALKKKCAEEKIDGVIAGFSEKKVSNAAKLCAALGKPFYTDGADIETIFNKALFLRACKKAHVDIPRQYKNLHDIEFPVVVKPVDNAGGRGVRVCTNKQELDSGLQNALSYSKSQTVLMEEYINGDETHIYFLVENGIPYFVIASDTMTLDCHQYKIKEYFGISYPSKYYPRILAPECQALFKTLIKSLNIQNGYIGFQCLVTDDRIVLHDPTFRVDGTGVHSVLSMEAGINDIDMLIHYSLTGSFPCWDSLRHLGAGKPKKIYREFSVLGRPGVIGEIRGVQDLRQIEGVYETNILQHVGSEIIEGNFLSSMVCQVRLFADNESDLRERLCKIFDCIKVNDVFGNDMVIRPDMSVFF